MGAPVARTPTPPLAQPGASSRKVADMVSLRRNLSWSPTLMFGLLMLPTVAEIPKWARIINKSGARME